MQSSLRLAFIVTFLISLTLLQACGFRLRGAVELPPQMQQAVARGVAPYSELGLALSEVWTQAGGRLQFGAIQPGAMQLTIKQNDISRRTLSVDNAGRPIEYELKYTLGFSLEGSEGKRVIEPQTVTLFRAYRFDPSNALAKSDEEARLKNDMTRQAAARMLQRISIQLKNRPSVTPDSSPTTKPEDETAR